VAKAIEKKVRDYGAVPATCAIINGSIKVGLTDEQLELLANPKNLVKKLSRRDLAHALTDSTVYGATTVASTMIIAR